jgi:subtilase family serine protease
MSRSLFTRGFTGCLATVSLAGLATFTSGCTEGTEPSLGITADKDLVVPAHAPAAPVNVSLRSGTVRLANAVHPYARPENDMGRLDPDQRIQNLSLFFKLSPEQRRDRDALVAAQLDSKSPEYRQWLTPEDYASRFGARTVDIASASAWLTAQGFEVHRTSRLGTRVTFSAKVKYLEAAFQTEMHHYVVGGETHYAMATAPAFPTALADIVLGLHNTHDFYPRPISGVANAAHAKQTKGGLRSHFEFAADGGLDGGPLDVLGPPDWANAYDVTKLYDPGIGGTKLDGTGVTIGIVGTAEIAQSDISAFRAQFGLPATTVTMTLVPDTGPAAAGRRGDGLEAILDTEWSGGIAKGATINYVYVGSTDHDVDDATFYLIEENLAPVISESYGGCEEGSLPSDADILEENGTAANLLGITYMAAAGDSGAADCGGGSQGPGLYVDMPGSFPGVTSVGGTQFPNPAWNSAGNLLAYPSLEQVWNESDDPFSEYGLGAGGGGISSVFSRPGYQAGVATCTPVGSLPFTTPPASAMRQVPDVAMSAAAETPGYVIECTYTGEDCAATGGTPDGIVIGGTSAASPTFAGIVAILNQAAGTRLGNINPLLYSLSAASITASPFHDIVSGTNEIVCGDAGAGDAGGPGAAGWPSGVGCAANGLYGFPATTGYDCASGLGSVDGYNLAEAMIGLSKTKTSLVPMPNETTEGTPVKLTATVDTIGANADVMTGNVTFTFESYTTTGAVDLSWELGTVALTGATSTTGEATLTTAIPPGLVKPSNQWVDVIAAYGGDSAHLPSVSPKVGVGFKMLDFAVKPQMIMLAPGGSETFTTTGGIGAVKWFIDSDTTRGRRDGGGFSAADIDETTGMLTVGDNAGYVEIAAIDSDSAEALAYVTVGDPTTPSPWSPDAGPFLDSGVPPLVDAGKDASAAKDAGPAKDASTHKDAAPPAKDADADKDAGVAPEGSSGCSCELAGGRESSGTGPLGALGGLVMGLGVFVRRRRRP